MFLRVMKFDNEHAGFSEMELTELPVDVLKYFVQLGEEMGAEEFGGCFGFAVKGNTVAFINSTLLADVIANLEDDVSYYIYIPEAGVDKLREMAVWKRGEEHG